MCFIHDWVTEGCLRILKTIRDVIPSEAEGGRLYIADSVLDEKSERLEYAFNFNLQILTFTVPWRRPKQGLTVYRGVLGSGSLRSTRTEGSVP